MAPRRVKQKKAEAVAPAAHPRRNARRARAATLLAPHRFRGGIRRGAGELSPRVTAGAREAAGQWLDAMPIGLPGLHRPVRITFARGLRTTAGDPGHAASFIPQRYLLLNESLLGRPGELGRILYHELCHFIWPRLRGGRGVYEAVVAEQLRRGVKGELGYSAELALSQLRAESPAARDRRWKHYVCESFCDTGAYVLLGLAGRRRARHSEWTLGARAREQRVEAWLRALSRN